MRGVYIPPAIEHFDTIFNSSRGGGINDIRVYNQPLQRGGSLFGVLGKIARYTIPFLKSIILPEIPSFVSNVSGDVRRGMRIRESLKNNSIRAAKNMGVRVLTKARGGTAIRKKHLKKKGANKKTSKPVKRRRNKIKNKNMSRDIFSLDEC
jgi:hypothetical protein